MPKIWTHGIETRDLIEIKFGTVHSVRRSAVGETIPMPNIISCKSVQSVNRHTVVWACNVNWSGWQPRKWRPCRADLAITIMASIYVLVLTFSLSRFDLSYSGVANRPTSLHVNAMQFTLRWEQDINQSINLFVMKQSTCDIAAFYCTDRNNQAKKRLR